MFSNRKARCGCVFVFVLLAVAVHLPRIPDCVFVQCAAWTLNWRMLLLLHACSLLLNWYCIWTIVINGAIVAVCAAYSLHMSRSAFKAMPLPTWTLQQTGWQAHFIWRKEYAVIHSYRYFDLWIWIWLHLTHDDEFPKYSLSLRGVSYHSIARLTQGALIT